MTQQRWILPAENALKGPIKAGDAQWELASSESSDCITAPSFILSTVTPALGTICRPALDFTGVGPKPMGFHTFAKIGTVGAGEIDGSEESTVDARCPCKCHVAVVAHLQFQPQKAEVGSPEHP